MRISSSKPMSPAVRFFIARIFPLPFIIAGAITLYLGVRGIVMANTSVDWPSVQGKVISSAVEQHRDSSDDSTTYHAEVFYEYSVDGTTFNGDRVAYGDYASGSPTHARRIVNRYPEAATVDVYYMPANPEECLLEPGIKAQSWFLPGFGLVFFVVGSLMAVFIPRAVKKQAPTKQEHRFYDD